MNIAVQLALVYVDIEEFHFTEKHNNVFIFDIYMLSMTRGVFYDFTAYIYTFCDSTLFIDFALEPDFLCICIYFVEEEKKKKKKKEYVL